MAARHRIPNALVRAAIDDSRRVIGVWVLLLILALPGLARLEVDTSTDSVLDRSDPAWAFYQESQELFGGDEILVVAIEGDKPFDAAVLERVELLTAAFEALPGVRRVDSLATVPLVYSTPDGALELHPALARAPAEADALSQYLAGRLQRDRIAPQTLVSRDGRVAAINIVLRKGSEKGHAALLAEVERLTRGTSVQISGVPVFRVETNGRTRQEVLAFAPVTGVLLLGLLALTLRSLSAAILCLVPGISGVWITLGAMGALAAPLTITTMILPSILLAFGCAYGMHVLCAASGAREPDALKRALRPVALPVALSGLTTVVGFISIALVRIDAVRFVGLFGSLGVLAITAATLTLVPVGLRLRPLPAQPPRGTNALRNSVCPLLVGWATRKGRWVLSAWLALVLVSALGATRIEVDTDATQWLPRGNPVRDAYESIRARLSGISPVNVVVKVPAGRSVLEPELLAAIDALASHLQQHPDVGRAISIADPLRQIHGGFLGADDQPLPDNADLTEQYLLLLESVEQIGDLVTGGRDAANVVLRVDQNGSSHLLRVADEARLWWQSHGPSDAILQPTGIMFEYARAEDEIAFGQIRGLTFALGVIAIILLAIFRWPRLALIALMPNVVPLTVIFGIMGLLRLPIDAGTVLVGSLALGIAVDDTIHVAAGFFDRLQEGRSAGESLRGSLDGVITAVTYTTVVISVAFVVLALSEFTFIRNLGLLTAVIMVLCLLADLTLLPSLLLLRADHWRRLVARRGPRPGGTRAAT